MFDITTVREIIYGSNNEHHVYVYRDHEQTNLWYMVPTPTLRRVGGAPAFSLVEYTANGGGISGLCSFEVELIQPPEARLAAEKILGEDTVWGGFTWVGGTAFFHYDLSGVTQIAAVEPTLYGTNVAAFQIELPDQAAVNTFVNAFSNGAGASPFRIEYDMQALTQLLGAEATVKYNAEAAITYQQTYRTERDTWGNQRTILVETKAVLQQSGAGDVYVKIGAGGTPELEQRVRDWAWTTLEQQVASTVNAAAVMATAPNPVSATTSFVQSYTEDTVVDWSTPVSTFMPKFTREEWDKAFTKVDNRRLAVNFALIGQLTRTGDGLPVAQRVTITVEYPTRTTDNTFELLVGNGAKSSLLYIADGAFVGSVYDPNYRYKYAIEFDKGGSYTSDWIASDMTQINITPSDFGTRQVSFIGAAVPFITGAGAGKVKEVMIDFFFTPPEGQQALVQTASMTGNGLDKAVAFNSYYNLPIGPSYSYKLRYLMSDNTVITSGAPVSFADAPGNTNSGNATIVYVPDPSRLYTQFDLRVFNLADATGVALVDLTAQYFDTQNNGDHALFQNTWNGWTPPGDKGTQTAYPPWNFQAVDNTNTAYYNMLGQIYYNDGRTVDLTNYKQPSGRKSFMIFSDSENYSVSIDTSLIDWEIVTAVYVNLFRLSDSAISLFEKGELPALLLKHPEEMTRAERAIAAPMQMDFATYSMLAAPAAQPVDDIPRHYALRRPSDQPQIEFYYTATYILADGTKRVLPQDHVISSLVLVLPPVPPVAEPGVTPGLVRHQVDPATLPVAARQVEPA